MSRYRVYLEAVQNPNDPVLISRLAKLSRRDEQAVRHLLSHLPALLADGVDETLARRLARHLGRAGARVEIASEAGSQPPAASLNLFQRIGWGFRVFRDTWGRQVLLLLVLAGVTVLAQAMTWMTAVPLGIDIAGGGPAGVAGLIQRGGAGAAGLALQVSILLAGFWYQVALVRISASALENTDGVGLGAALATGWRRLPDLVSAVGLLALPAFLLVGGVSLVGGALLLPAEPRVFAVLTAATVLVMIAVGVGFSLVLPATVLESRGPWGSLARAWRLSRGRRWRILGNALVVAVSLGVLSLGAELAVSLASAALGMLVPGGAFAGLVLSTVLLLLLYALGLFLLNFLLLAFYWEARIQDEAWAPAWIAAPDPSWPLRDGAAGPAQGRGLRAWLELLLYSGLAAGALMTLLFVLRGQMAGLAPGNGSPAPVFPSKPEPGDSAEALGDTSSIASVSGSGTPAIELTTEQVFPFPNGANMGLGVVLVGAGELPRGLDTGDMLRIEIAHVEGVTGEDLYAADNPLETGFNQKVALEPGKDGRWRGLRTVYLNAPVTRDQIETVSGEAVLRLPRGVEAIALAPGDAGANRGLGDGLSLTLVRLQASELELGLRGEGAAGRLAGLVGMTPDGEILEPDLLSTTTRGDLLRVSAQFSAPVASARVILARDWEETRLPFSMRTSAWALLQPPRNSASR